MKVTFLCVQEACNRPGWELITYETEFKNGFLNWNVLKHQDYGISYNHTCSAFLDFAPPVSSAYILRILSWLWGGEEVLFLRRSILEDTHLLFRAIVNKSEFWALEFLHSVCEKYTRSGVKPLQTIIINFESYVTWIDQQLQAIHHFFISHKIRMRNWTKSEHTKAILSKEK